MKCNFTFEYYDEVLKLALDKGYRFLLFQDDPKKYKKIIYLRHDIDITPDNAIKLAEIENKHRIRATYFFLLHDIFYNILEEKVLADIQTLQKLGHQIGLHFDENFNIDSKSILGKRVIQDLKLMENILGIKIITVSFHNPVAVLKKEVQDKRFINVYSNEYFKEIKYLSDSLQRWRDGGPCEVFGKEKYDKMQILVHPVLWNKKPLSFQKILNSYMFLRCNRMNSYCYKILHQEHRNLKKLCPFSSEFQK